VRHENSGRQRLSARLSNSMEHRPIGRLIRIVIDADDLFMTIQSITLDTRTRRHGQCRRSVESIQPTGDGMLNAIGSLDPELLQKSHCMPSLQMPSPTTHARYSAESAHGKCVCPANARPLPKVADRRSRHRSNFVASVAAAIAMELLRNYRKAA
jgi:hypothetical protein